MTAKRNARRDQPGAHSGGDACRDLRRRGARTAAVRVRVRGSLVSGPVAVTARRGASTSNRSNCSRRDRQSRGKVSARFRRPFRSKPSFAHRYGVARALKNNPPGRCRRYASPGRSNNRQGSRRSCPIGACPSRPPREAPSALAGRLPSLTPEAEAAAPAASASSSEGRRRRNVARRRLTGQRTMTSSCPINGLTDPRMNCSHRFGA
jgi:hypothetical protein